MKQIEELKYLLKDNSEELEYYLHYLIKQNTYVVNTLEKVIEEAKKEDKLLVRVGLFNILKENYPVEYDNLRKHIEVKKFLKK